jgi:hypothetical protein
MLQPDEVQRIWESSSTRSLYNSPDYARFSETNGNEIRFEELNDGAVLPYARPNVWTHWHQTRIPIPSMIAPKHSIYHGLLLPQNRAGFDFDALMDRIYGLRWSTFFPRISFVQSALVEDGPADFLQEFSAAIDSSSGTQTPTTTRVIHLPLVASQEPRADELDLGGLHEQTAFDSIMETYASKRRYDIRRAEREGVVVLVTRVGSDRAAADLYSTIMAVHQESWSRTGLGPHSYSYWLQLSRAIRESGGHDIVSRAFNSAGELIAVSVVHLRGKSAYYQMNSSTLEGHRLSANPLSLHAAISVANFWGTEYFELGRSSVTENPKAKSVMDYKEQFGGQSYIVPNFVITTPFDR